MGHGSSKMDWSAHVFFSQENKRSARLTKGSSFGVILYKGAGINSWIYSTPGSYITKMRRFSSQEERANFFLEHGLRASPGCHHGWFSPASFADVSIASGGRWVKELYRPLEFLCTSCWCWLDITEWKANVKETQWLIHLFKAKKY